MNNSQIKHFSMALKVDEIVTKSNIIYHLTKLNFKRLIKARSQDDTIVLLRVLLHWKVAPKNAKPCLVMPLFIRSLDICHTVMLSTIIIIGPKIFIESRWSTAALWLVIVNNSAVVRWSVSVVRGSKHNIDWSTFFVSTFLLLSVVVSFRWPLFRFVTVIWRFFFNFILLKIGRRPDVVC